MVSNIFIFLYISREKFVEKFSKCCENGIACLRKGKLHRRANEFWPLSPFFARPKLVRSPILGFPFAKNAQERLLRRLRDLLQFFNKEICHLCSFPSMDLSKNMITTQIYVVDLNIIRGAEKRIQCRHSVTSLHKKDPKPL